MGRFTGGALVDFNNDGLKDLLVTEACGEPIGNKNGPGGIKFYLNTGSIGDPVFTFQKYLRDVVGNKIEHLYLRAQFFDMDNDGLVDIVTGENDFNGVPSELRFYENSGTVDSPIFEPGVVLTHVDGSGILADNAIHFGIADIDNDGIKDILLNARHHNIKNWSNYQYEAQIGFLKGSLEVTGINSEVVTTTKGNSLVIRNGIINLKGVTKLSVYTTSGRVLKNIDVHKNDYSLKLSKLKISKGIYLLKYESHESVKTMKIRM